MNEFTKAIVLILVLAVPISTLGMVVIGGGDGTWTHERLVKINAPPADVFEALTAKRQHWKQLQSSRMTGPGGPRVGSKILEVAVIDGKEHMSTANITDFKLDEVLALRIEGEPVDLSVRYELTLGGSMHRTRLRMRADGQFHHWAAKLYEPVSAYWARERMDEELDALKEYAETHR